MGAGGGRLGRGGGVGGGGGGGGGLLVLWPATCFSAEARNHATLGLTVQVLCESRGGRPGLSVLTSLLVSVDVKIY